MTANFDLWDWVKGVLQTEAAPTRGCSAGTRWTDRACEFRALALPSYQTESAALERQGRTVAIEEQLALSR
jgi:hypothetical protein